MKGFELVIWPGFKECKNRNHAHKCGWWEGAKGWPGGQRLLQHTAPAPPVLPKPAAVPAFALRLYRAVGRGGTPSPLPPPHLPQQAGTP